VYCTVTDSEASGERFFTPGTVCALIFIVLAMALVGLRPLAGPSVVSDKESTALLELQSKLLVGMATVDEARAREEATKLESLAGGPAGARALAALYLYLDDDALRERARTLLTEASSDAAEHALLLRAAQGEVTWPEPEAELLRTRLGWFGELVLAESDPATLAKVRQTGERLVIVVGLGGFAVLAGLGLGVILLVTAVAMRAQWNLRMEPASVGRGIYVQAFAVYLWIMIAGGQIAGLAGGAVAGSAVVILLSLVAGLGYPLLRRVPWSVMRRELGLHRGRGFWREVGAGVVTYVASLPVIAAGIAVTVGLQAWAGGPDESPQAISHPIVGIMKGADWPVMLVLGLLASIQGPVVEEVMFRGALYGGLRSRLGKTFSLLAMAFCFAAVHPQGLLAIPALMGLALAFGFMREWRGSLVAGIVTHGLHNGVLLAFMALALGG